MSGPLVKSPRYRATNCGKVAYVGPDYVHVFEIEVARRLQSDFERGQQIRAGSNLEPWVSEVLDKRDAADAAQLALAIGKAEAVVARQRRTTAKVYQLFGEAGAAVPLSYA